MSRFCWLFCAAALLPAAAPPAAAAQTATLTLRQAIDRALGGNPQAAAADAQVQSAGAAAALARSALLPQINFAEDISRGDDPVYAFGTRLRQQMFTEADFALNALNRPTPVGNFATRFSGRWQLFDGWASQDRLQAARSGLKSAGQTSEAVRQAIVLRVVQAYEGVLYAQREVDVARSEQQTAQALLHDAQTRVKAGLAVNSDLLTAQVNLAEREQDQMAAEGRLEIAWAELETAIGSPIAPRPALRSLEEKNFPGEALDQDIAQALKTRPDLEALRSDVEARQRAVRAAKADFLPQIGAYGNWEMDRETFAGSGGENWVAGVQLSLDLLPLARRERLRQEEAARQASEAQQRSAELETRLAVERAFAGYRTAGRIVATARAATEQSGESLRVLRNRYNSGLATMTDLLRGEDAQRESQNGYWRAAWNNVVSYAALLYATGRLTPDIAEVLQ